MAKTKWGNNTKQNTESLNNYDKDRILIKMYKTLFYSLVLCHKSATHTVR